MLMKENLQLHEIFKQKNILKMMAYIVIPKTMFAEPYNENIKVWLTIWSICILFFVFDVKSILLGLWINFYRIMNGIDFFYRIT